MPFRGNTIITTNTKAQLQTGDYHLSFLSSPLPLSSHPAGWRWFQSESWHRQPSPAFALTLPLHEYLHNRKQSVYSVQAQAQGSKWFGSDCCFRYRWLCSNLSVCLSTYPFVYSMFGEMLLFSLLRSLCKKTKNKNRLKESGRKHR